MPQLKIVQICDLQNQTMQVTERLELKLPTWKVAMKLRYVAVSLKLDT